MTPQQLALLRFIRGYAAEHEGMAPTISEMAQAIQIRSRGGVMGLLACLEAEGRIRRRSKARRGIEVVDHAADLASASTSDLIAEARRRGFLVQLREGDAPNLGPTS